MKPYTLQERRRLIPRVVATGLRPGGGRSLMGGLLRSPPMATARVNEILSWYASENPGVKANLARMMNHGRLAGTGRFVILPVDQGFEHGPARSFAPNPSGYDPRYHI